MSSQPLQTFGPSSPSSPPRRERPISRLSFKSDKSAKSLEAKPIIDTVEYTKDKRRLDMRGKANPNRAIQEIEPAARNATENMTMAHLRTVEHKDTDGNVIVDPDRSNPTRPRMERPLDTIRSFEAAIDNSYRRNSPSKNDAQVYNAGSASRRSSSYNTLDQYQQPRYGSSYYNSPRSGGPRQDYYNEPPSSYYNRKPAYPRNLSEPMLYTAHRPQMSTHHTADPYYDQYDTDHTASAGSLSTEPWGNSTDPSSENSSIDPATAHHHAKYDTADPYGRSPPIQTAVMEESSNGVPSRRPIPGQTANANANANANAAPMRPPPQMNRPRSSHMQNPTSYAAQPQAQSQPQPQSQSHIYNGTPQQPYIQPQPIQGYRQDPNAQFGPAGGNLSAPPPPPSKQGMPPSSYQGVSRQQQQQQQQQQYGGARQGRLTKHGRGESDGRMLDYGKGGAYGYGGGDGNGARNGARHGGGTGEAPKRKGWLARTFSRG